MREKQLVLFDVPLKDYPILQRKLDDMGIDNPAWLVKFIDAITPRALQELMEQVR